LKYFILNPIVSKREFIKTLRTMVAPPQSNIRDIWGNLIGVNGALARIQELRETLLEMQIHPERFGRHHFTGIAIYEYYQDEMEYLEGQLNNQY